MGLEISLLSFFFFFFKFPVIILVEERGFFLANDTNPLEGPAGPIEQMGENPVGG